MTQTESLEEYGRFRAAWAYAVVATDPHHNPSLGAAIQTSGTVSRVELPETEDLMAYYPPDTSRSAEDKLGVTVMLSSAHYAVRSIAYGHSHEWNILRVDNDSAVDTIGLGAAVLAAAVAAAVSNEDIHEIVDFARRSGLDDVADRLVVLFDRPLDGDEAPLQSEAAMSFVKYCVAREKKGRPLMTVTPAGELGVTWKGPRGQWVLVRFLAGGLVWIAFKLLKEKGAFEANARDLVNQTLRFKLPEWA